MNRPSDTLDTSVEVLQLNLVRAAVVELVAPLVAADGGTIDVVMVRDHAVAVLLGGACLGCPARAMTRDLVIVPILTRALGVPIHVDLV